MKNKEKKSNRIITSCLLYLFLIFMWIIILNYAQLQLNNIIKIISIIYLILSLLVTYTYYNKISQNKDFEKKLLQGISIIFVYFFTSLIEPYFLLLIDKTNTIIKEIFLITYEIIQISIIVIIVKEKLKKDIDDFKLNYKIYFTQYFKYHLIAIFIMTISNLLISIINPNNISSNEIAIRTIIKEMPLYIYISSIIIGPIMEEMVFRLGIKNIITNKKLFIITSGLVFGLLHVIGDINNPINLLYIIPYSIPGIAFAYILSKTDNILVPTSFHILHNLITLFLI